jgi:acyl-CoA synthetase (AMP-forming)/AMP-acid ligase II
LNQLSAYRSAIQLTSEDVVVSWLPLYHDMGLIAGFIMPIMEGIPLVLMSPFDWVRAPQRLMQAVSKYKGTLSWLPNFAYNFCAQKIRDRHLEGVDLSSWRAITNCSEPVRYESHIQFYEKFKSYGLKFETLQTSYAMAENVFGVTQSDLQRRPTLNEIDREAFLHEHVAQPARDGMPVMRMMSSGKPISNTKIRILNAHGKDVPERTIGEIALQSNSMLTEYYHRPDATAKAFHDGWYLTGDYGYLVDGELYVTGRKKDMIIVGGKNVYPQDIESLVGQVEGIHAGRVVAFGMYDETQGTEEVVVLAETDAQEDPNEIKRISDAVRAHVTKNSAVALRWVYLVGPKWLLKTSSGKIARSANKEKYLKEIGKDQ